MSSTSLKLSVYFGERDRVGGRFLAERLIDVFEAHGIAVSLLLRGAEGFGIKHQIRTDRRLTLSEDLPIVAMAIDAAARIEGVLEEVRGLSFDGLITIERVHLPDGVAAGPVHERLGPEVKLTIYLGRGLRSEGEPLYERVVRVLHGGGVGGASVLLGVDGTIRGSRRRARFFSRNSDVPASVISIGARERVAEVLPELAKLPGETMVTLERVRSLRRDGRRLADLEAMPGSDAAGLERWIMLTLYSSEANQSEGRPAHIAAIRALRANGAPGATALKGIWGYHGDHEPHGDRFWSVRRRVPTVTVVVDRPTAASRWLEVLEAAAPERGLITAEVVPALQATGPQTRTGGLRLAESWVSD